MNQVTITHNSGEFHKGDFIMVDSGTMKARFLVTETRDTTITVMGWEGSEFSMTEVLECKKGNVRLFHSLRDLMIWLRGDDA